jgi:H+-translocating NAD(P) transhydrogenase subunit beta
MSDALLYNFVNATYFFAALLFILGLKRMSSPVTAQAGIVIAGWGMLVATLATFVHPEIRHAGNLPVTYGLMVAAIALGGGIAWVSGKRVAMTDMPQMIAIYNGMGGGAAAAIAAIELLKAAEILPGTPAGTGREHSTFVIGLAVAGALIGSVSFSGSAIAFAKLQGLMNKTYALPAHHFVSFAFLIAAVLMGAYIVMQPEGSTTVVIAFFITAVLYGVLMTLPIGGADMPVVISLYNAFTGLAVGLEGYVLNNAAMIVAGIVVGSAGTLLTQLMAKAMNRPIAKLLTPPTGSAASTQKVEGTQKPIEAGDVAALMAYAQKVIIIPGYGMAVAQAQHKVWELAKLLRERGVEVKFAIHPVAGRMPGHMNVLLAEAGVPYDMIFDIEEINSEFPTTDVAFVIGANDVVNPAARTDKSSPIYGMPILDADKAKNVIVNKRGKGSGFSGIENLLFYQDNTRMFYGGGAEAVAKLVQELKLLAD